MLPVKTIEKFCNAPDAGYCSVYLFDKASADQIVAAKSSAGLARYPVYTDTLIIDLDKGKEQLEACLEAVKGAQLQVFESGGKGYHVVLSLDALVSGQNVPYSQRKWVESLDVSADLSLYQAGHIVALPGRLHPKTGKRKVLISSQPGDLLSLPLLDQEPPTFAVGGGDQSELERGLWRTLSLLQQGPDIGGRHTAIWSTAKHFADSGLDYSTALDLLWAVNQTWEEPKERSEVETAVKQAFRVPTT